MKRLVKSTVSVFPRPVRVQIQRVIQHPLLSRRARVRRRLSREWLSGRGIEIGALHLPLWLPPGASATYVDRLPTRELLAANGWVAGWPVVDVEIVDDAETLSNVPDGSQDFLIANHVIEHMENPIGALENWLRVLRPGGALYFAVPHRERTFDRYRDGTPLEAVLRDYREGPEWSRRDHYEEWVEKVEGVKGPEGAALVEKRLRDHQNIHFHAWTDTEFEALLHACLVDVGLPLADVNITPNGMEFVVTARRAPQ